MFKFLKLLSFLTIFTSSAFSQNYWEHIPETKGGGISKIVKNEATSRLYAISISHLWSGGVYISDDNGITWERINHDILKYAKVVDISSNSLGDLLVGTESNGIYFYESLSDSWKKLGIPNPYNISFVNFLSDNEYLITTSFNVQYSPDGGVNWLLNTIPARPTELKIGTDKKIFLGTPDGLYWTDNLGVQWQLFDKAPQKQIDTFCLIDEEKILLCSVTDWYYTDDFGTSWVKRNNQYMQALSIHKLSNGNLITNTGQYIYKSTNNGETWTKVSTFTLFYGMTESLMLDDNTMLMGQSNGIYISHDQGKTISTSRDNIYQNIMWGIASSKDKTVSILDRNKVLISENDVNTWQLFESQTNSQPSATNVYFFDNKFFATSYYGISYSNDGKVWFTNSNTSDNNYSMNLIVKGNYHFHTKSGELFRSTDSGANWIKIELPKLDNTSKFCFDNNGRLYCCGQYYLFYSDDLGENWSFNQLPVENIIPSKLTVNSDNNIFIAGDNGLLLYNYQENTWQNLTPSIINSTKKMYKTHDASEINISSIIADPKTNAIIIGVSHDDKAIEVNESAFLSIDSGKNWDNISDGLESIQQKELSMDSTGNIFVATKGYGLFRSSIKFTKSSYSTDIVEFGNVVFNSKDTVTIDIQNAGYGTLNISDISIDNTGFQLSDSSFTIEQDQSESLNIIFNARTEGLLHAKLFVESNSLWGPDTIDITANCVASHFSTVSDSIKFLHTKKDSTSIKPLNITNDGTYKLEIDSIIVNNEVFNYQSFVDSINIGQNHDFEFTFTPDTINVFNGSAVFYTNSITSPDTIFLSGETAHSFLHIDYNSIEFTNLFFGHSADSSLILSNLGNVDLIIDEISSSSEKLEIADYNNTILPDSNILISVMFTPDSLRDYSEFIEIISSSITSPDTIFFTWSSQYAQLLSTVSSISFGEVPIDVSVDSTITIKNIGISDLSVNCILSEGEFSVSQTNFIIASDDSLDLVITCNTSSTGEIRDTLIFESNSATSPDIILLSAEAFDPTDIEKSDDIPTEYSLKQNYPNPFNPSTTIEYSVPESGQVTIKLYDTLGSEIRTLVKSNHSIGNYSVRFNAQNLPSGVYFYRIESGNFSDTKKLILLK